MKSQMCGYGGKEPIIPTTRKERAEFTKMWNEAMQMLSKYQAELTPNKTN